MDELRKAAGTAVDVWDDTGTRHEDVVNAMNDLRKVLAKNANAAPDVSTSKTILVGRYIRENGLDSQCFTYPDDLPDGQYEMYLRNLTSDCKTYSEQLPRVCQMQAAREDRRYANMYRWLRDRDHWPASFDSHTAPEPVRGPELDAAIEKVMSEQPMENTK